MDTKRTAETLDILEEPGPRIRLNIGGQHFETFKSNLESVPNTRVSALSPGDPSYYPEFQEYFFDRNPCLFPYILDAFRKGEVNFPISVPAVSIRAELAFWGIDEGKLSASSWKTCREWDAQQKTLSLLNESKSNGIQGNGRNNALWLLLEEPSSSLKATVWSVFYILMILVTVAVISAMTLPGRNVYKVEYTSDGSEKHKSDDFDQSLEIVFLICALFFASELVIRFTVCPDKRRFFNCFFNYVDILAVVPMFIVGIISIAIPHLWQNSQPISFGILYAVLSVLRAIRILKIWKQIRCLHITFLAVKESLKEVFFIMLTLVVGISVLATILFHAEKSAIDSQFSSIPSGLWYSIATMTTVGYGDVVPVTRLGQFFGSVGALCGILVLSMPIPVFVKNFRLYYDHARVRGKVVNAQQTGTKETKI